MTAAVRVVVPMFASERTVGETLDSLRAQTFGDWRCIVVDDGSADDGPAIVRGYAERDPRIELVSKANGGLASARNAGLDAPGDEPFVHFLDADDWLEPGGLDALVGVLGGRPRAHAAAGSTVVRKQSGDAIAHRGPPADGFGLHALRSVAFVVTHAQLFRRGVFERARFDESRARVEDYDMWLRLAEGGVEWATTDVPVCGYRVRAGSISSAWESMLGHTLEVLRGSIARAGNAGLPDPVRVENSVRLNWATRAALASGGSAEEAFGTALGMLGGAEGITPGSAACAAIDAAVFGLARDPGSFMDELEAACRGWWDGVSRALGLGESFAGDAARCLRGLAWSPDEIAARLLRAAGGGDAVRLIGFGQNGRRIARLARAQGLRVVVRDDRIDLGQLGPPGEGIEHEPMAASLDNRVPTIVTVADDAWVLDRIAPVWCGGGELLRWAGDSLRGTP